MLLVICILEQNNFVQKRKNDIQHFSLSAFFSLKQASVIIMQKNYPFGNMQHLIEYFVTMKYSNSKTCILESLLGSLVLNCRAF